MIPQPSSVVESNSSPARMQVTRDPMLSSSECAEIRGKTREDSTGAENLEKPLLSEREAEEKGEQEQGDGGDDGGGDEDEDGEFEFTFACANPEGSPVAADAIFENGRIRPVYPLFDRKLLFAAGDGGSQPPLRELFVQRRGLSSSSSSSDDEGDELAGVPEGTYCVWRGKTIEEGEETSPEGCRKSNSTGFSKLWRFRELARRSSSDGKDAFVFLNPRRRGKEEGEKEGVKAATTSKGGKKGPAATARVANEKNYVMPRATREGERRKSYLPYKQVGFFTNVNGMSRNVHPF